MTVALHICEDSFQHYGINFNLETGKALAKQFPQHHFIFIYDHQMPAAALLENCTTVVCGPAIKNDLSRYYWYNFKLTSVLKKYNADVLVPHANCFSLNAKAFRFFIQDQSEKKQNKREAKYILKANAVLNISAVQKNAKHKSIVYGLPEIFHPYTFYEKEKIKEQHTGESDYFFSIISPEQKNQFKTLLKAFSHFKKWQKSSLKLVVLLQAIDIPDFNLYKFRDDVVIRYFDATDVQTKADLMSAAYANIVADEKDVIASFIIAVPPVWISENENTFGDAVLYATADEKSISKQMIQVYKDELLRNNMIENGKAMSATYTWENAATTIAESIGSL